MSDSQVTTLDDAPDADGTPVKTVKTAKTSTSKAAMPKAESAMPADADAPEVEAVQMFNVTVHATGDDAGTDVVEVQPNGRLYRLPRGVPCLVPAAVLHILENAVVTKYKVVGSNVVESNTPRFPFTATPA